MNINNRFLHGWMELLYKAIRYMAQLAYLNFIVQFFLVPHSSWSGRIHDSFPCLHVTYVRATCKPDLVIIIAN